MKKIFLFGCIAAILFVACNNEPQDSKDVAEETNEARLDSLDMEDDGEFAVKAADGGIMEVRLGEMAKQNAASAEVKEFGTMMVADHSKANEELKALAAQKNIALPTSLSNDKQKKVDNLAKLKGAEFDKEYISFMVKDLKEDIEEFSEHTRDGKDSTLVRWASEKLPALQHHLREAERIDSLLKNRQ